jgi:hypothetical protein
VALLQKHDNHATHCQRERKFKKIYAKGQEVLGYHDMHRWQLSVMEDDRGDGEYVLAWADGEKTDGVKSSNNMRLGVRAQYLHMEMQHSGLT